MISHLMPMYVGISVGWQWGFGRTGNANSVISSNYISTIGQGQLSDMGCIYHLGIDSGTLIEGNICTNTSSYYYGGWGYYLDEGSSNVTVRGNLAFDLKTAGFTQHYGRCNIPYATLLQANALF